MNGIKKKRGENFPSAITIMFICLMTIAIIPAVTGVTPVDLKTAGGYAILSKTGITTEAIPATMITGDIGSSLDAEDGGITGFSLVGDGTAGFKTSSLVTGNVYTIKYAAPTPGKVAAAVADMEAAYTDAAGSTRGEGFLNIGGGTLTNQNLIPGVYTWTSAVGIPTDLTLDAQGDANAVWIFRINGALTTGAGKKIILSNGAQPDNIFWAVTGGDTALGANSVFCGNILDTSAIALGAGTTLHGRALAQSAVTLGGSTVTTPVPRAGPVAGFTFTNATGTTPLTVSFTDVSIFDPTSLTNTYAWDFNNDGLIESTARNPVYVFDIPGTFTPNLTVTDSYGATATVINTVTVYQRPVAGFTFTPAVGGPAYLRVAFTDTSTVDPAATIRSWAWDFDNDGNIDNTTRNPVYVYDIPDTYTPNLTITDSHGATATTINTIDVTPPTLAITVTNVPISLTLAPDVTIPNTAILFYVNSTANWQVSAYDADPGTAGKMTRWSGGVYDLSTQLTRPFMVQQNAGSIFVNLPAGSSSAVMIQSGTPEVSATAYPLGVRQEILMTDSVLPGENVYHIVVTLMVSAT